LFALLLGLRSVDSAAPVFAGLKSMHAPQKASKSMGTESVITVLALERAGVKKGFGLEKKGDAMRGGTSSIESIFGRRNAFSPVDDI
jgi:hypothetical protein